MWSVLIASLKTVWLMGWTSLLPKGGVFLHMSGLELGELEYGVFLGLRPRIFLLP
jgi:hypothetical protein